MRTLFFGRYLAVNVLYKYEHHQRLTFYLFGCILLGFATEMLQEHIPGRGLDFYDALADTLGIVIAYYFYKMNVTFAAKVLKTFGA